MESLGKALFPLVKGKKAENLGKTSVGHTLLSGGAEADNRITLPLAQHRNNHSFFPLLCGVLQYGRAAEKRDQKNKTGTKREYYFKNDLLPV